MIGQKAIAISLPEFGGLGHSVSPTFLSRIKLYLQLSPRCPKMSKKSIWEVKKKFKISFHGNQILPSCGYMARGTVIAKYELVL